MTEPQDIDPAKIRVIYTRPQYCVLGPLGCFYKGQEITLPDGSEVTITSVDPDGAGVARTVDQAEAAVNLPPNWRSQPCYDLSHPSEHAREGMLAQQARNRKEAGVVLPAA